MIKLIKYTMLDILRSKVIIAYTIFLLALSLSIFSLEDNAEKGLISLLNIILIVVPLVSLIFSTIYMYNAHEFTEMLVSQPLRRTQILISLFQGICFSLLAATAIGVGIPVILLEGSSTGYMIVIAGFLLTAIFVSLAVLCSVTTRDKAKGTGISILLWLYFCLLYDGLLLFVLFQFSDYPLEKTMLVLCSLNPVDLARVFILLKMDIAALMGYTGAVFSRFFNTDLGILYTFFLMLFWIAFPLLIAINKFRKKDL